MSKQFHPHFSIAAWAREAPDKPLFMSGRDRGTGSLSGRWGDEPRIRRGELKFILLEVLSERPRYVYELMKELEARRGDFRRSSPGSVYPALQMLQDGSYLTTEEVEGKRICTITDSGRQFLHERNSQSDSRRTHGRSRDKPSELIELRQITEINHALTQLAQSGNLVQANLVYALLVQVEHEIYKLLTEE